MTGTAIYGGIGVRWRISPKLKAKYYLKSVPGLFLLNPLEYISNYIEQGFVDIENDFTFKGESFIETRGIIFGRTPQYRLKTEDAWDKVAELFKFIKVYSLQYDLNYRHFHSFSDAERLMKSNVIPNTVLNFGMYEYRFATFLKWQDFIKIDKAKARGLQMPVHREIFLDAFSADFEGDYKKAILYFCMACETKLSEKLFNKYEDLKSKNKLPRAMKDSGGTKDPVYEILKRDKWQFKFKLHEHYIYLFGTSLLIENKTLYDNLCRLYHTRNKIVHEGEIKVPTNQLLTIDNSGSNLALDFSIDFFDWLGDKSFQIFKNRKMTIVK